MKYLPHFKLRGIERSIGRADPQRLDDAEGNITLYSLILVLKYVFVNELRSDRPLELPFNRGIVLAGLNELI